MVSPIHSGSSYQRIVRVGLLTLMVIGFASAYLWDGYRGYPSRNRQELGQQLGLTERDIESIVIRPELTAARAGELIDIIGQERPRDQNALSLRLSEPSYVRGREFYYLGAAGWLRVEQTEAGDFRAEWVNAGKSETDLAWQRWIGSGLSVFGLALAFYLYRVVSVRSSLTDTGLRIGRHSPIPIDAITSIHANDFGKTGRVEFRGVINGREVVVPADDYEVKELKSLVAAVCEARGLENPLKRQTEQPPAG